MPVVEILGNFYNNHSLSIVNRKLAIELSKEPDISLFVTPLDSYDSKYKISKDEIRIIKSLQNKNSEEPDVQLRHTYPPMWRYPVSAKTKIVFIQPWEYSKIPFEWQYKWETFADAVITPSMWSGDRILESGLNPKDLFVIPNGYDETVYNTKPEDSKFYDKKKFTFVFVGNHQKRKGLDILLEAWRQSFVRADNVQLFIKDSPQIYGQNNLLSQILAMQYKMDCGKILYNDDLLSEEEMANIYKNAKVLVHPYRGEGFGMHVQEATACGALPIITAGGPTEEFIPQEIGFRIESGKMITDLTAPDLFAIKPGDSLTLMGGYGWILEPSLESLKFSLRLIYSHHERQRFFDKVKEYDNPNTWANVAYSYKLAIMEINGRSETPKRIN